MAFPAAVEALRPIVAKHFPPELVDKALYVIMHESGGNPAALGDGGVAIGLFQIQDDTRFEGRPTKEQLLDPEFNIAYAANQLGAAKGNWAPWGEGVTYQGQPFGALGNHPYGEAEDVNMTMQNPGDLPAGARTIGGNLAVWVDPTDGTTYYFEYNPEPYLDPTTKRVVPAGWNPRGTPNQADTAKEPKRTAADRQKAASGAFDLLRQQVEARGGKIRQLGDMDAEVIEKDGTKYTMSYDDSTERFFRDSALEDPEKARKTPLENLFATIDRIKGGDTRTASQISNEGSMSGRAGLLADEERRAEEAQLGTTERAFQNFPDALPGWGANFGHLGKAGASGKPGSSEYNMYAATDPLVAYGQVGTGDYGKDLQNLALQTGRSAAVQEALGYGQFEAPGVIARRDAELAKAKQAAEIARLKELLGLTDLNVADLPTYAEGGNFRVKDPSAVVNLFSGEPQALIAEKEPETVTVAPDNPQRRRQPTQAEYEESQIPTDYFAEKAAALERPPIGPLVPPRGFTLIGSGRAVGPNGGVWVYLSQEMIDPVTGNRIPAGWHGDSEILRRLVTPAQPAQKGGVNLFSGATAVA